MERAKREQNPGPPLSLSFQCTVVCMKHTGPDSLRRFGRAAKTKRPPPPPPPLQVSVTNSKARRLNPRKGALRTSPAKTCPDQVERSQLEQHPRLRIPAQKNSETLHGPPNTHDPPRAQKRCAPDRIASGRHTQTTTKKNNNNNNTRAHTPTRRGGGGGKGRGGQPKEPHDPDHRGPGTICWSMSPMHSKPPPPPAQNLNSVILAQREVQKLSQKTGH